MDIESIVIPATNDFASLYIAQKEPVKGFFHYDITENTVFEKRVSDLLKRNFDREGLAKCIEAYMKPFPSSEQTKRSLQKLRCENSTVVIGGQQAGLLTGPLYTIHKIISIIKLAEQQEEQLGIPVVPVFWIAGEDHDFLEINHVYVEVGKEMEKINFPRNPNLKHMASDIHYDKEVMSQWIDTVFLHFGERSYTKEMLDTLHTAVAACQTVTEFFSYLIMSLFKEYGVLIIDSADPNLRTLEEPFFYKLIEQAAPITKSVFAQQDIISGFGFNNMIEINNGAANLFYYKDNERILLNYNSEEGIFESGKGHFQIRKEDLLQVLQSEPERLSNNVVTRPLMQEWLFPTLAFIAGPGEIAYWGELKQAFELLKMEMPPLIPRMNMTFLESAVERDINELNLSLDEILKGGVAGKREKYLKANADELLGSQLDEISATLDEKYQAILKRLEASDRGLLPLAQKNLDFHIKQIEFLKQKANWALEQKHQSELEKYNRIERSLRPNGSPQERVWNIYYYLNISGEDFIRRLMSLQFVFDGKHKIIKI
ncbi:bacillithiol biosynthesis cysteine-adding enzyme BshC [Bacillus niameyensis]|uniref:bacillithiol biosynthesis cysteine-adding enzyme BshC n=1 Tax=Bacillus niameyensis TaxID=1522308 RepID=UPI0007807714|nr:bacillithiol biosynthesis cysteine-adding enzyme BshC [Bacillus niameyensis]